MKLSIIIPVYNVAPYLRRCLDSCLEQNIDVKEYEIIVVNDGSTDNSLDIINCYLLKYQNLKLIDKPNGGLSSARNAGLNIASGDFIWFVDSDDWIRKDCVKEIIDVFKMTDAEVLTYDALGSDGINDFPLGKKRKLENMQVFNGMKLLNSGYVYPFSAVQFYIFKREFLNANKLVFLEGIFFEDILFTALMMTVVKRCVYVHAHYYYYLIRQGSITNSKASLKKANDYIVIAKKLFSYIETISCQSSYILYFNIAKCVLELYVQWYQISKEERAVVRKKFLENRFWLYCIIKARSPKYLLPYLLIKFNIHVKIK